MKKWLTPQNLMGFVSLICAGLFWIYTQNTLPKKVENHESRIKQLEQNNVELKTKLDLTLNAVYEIRAVLLRNK